MRPTRRFRDPPKLVIVIGEQVVGRHAPCKEVRGGELGLRRAGGGFEGSGDGKWGGRIAEIGAEAGRRGFFGGRVGTVFEDGEAEVADSDEALLAEPGGGYDVGRAAGGSKRLGWF
jgi:hypothetical protein